MILEKNLKLLHKMFERKTQFLQNNLIFIQNHREIILNTQLEREIIIFYTLKFYFFFHQISNTT